MWLTLTDDRRVLRTAAAPAHNKKLLVSALGFTEQMEPHCPPLLIQTPDNFKILGMLEVLL